MSFESNEDLSIVTAYKTAVVQYGATGATDGKRAMKVSVGTLDADYSGVEIKPAAPWNLGSKPLVVADVTNPNALPIQLRANVTDKKGALRTYYFAIGAKESRTISIAQFKASDPVWGEQEGFWGAEATGLDASGIASIQLYLWEDAPESGDSFVIDNLRLSQK